MSFLFEDYIYLYIHIKREKERGRKVFFQISFLIGTQSLAQENRILLNENWMHCHKLNKNNIWSKIMFSISGTVPSFLYCILLACTFGVSDKYQVHLSLSDKSFNWKKGVCEQM